jgi:hypothetical protein
MDDFDALKAAAKSGRAVVCVFAVNGPDGIDTMTTGAIITGRATAKDLAAMMAGMLVKATEAPKLLADLMGGEQGEGLLERVSRYIESPTLEGGQTSGMVSRRDVTK